MMRDGKFAAVQLPFNYIDDEAAAEAIPLARELDMGFIAMKPFGGGLLCDAKLSIKYLSRFGGIVPDPGIEKLSEIEEIARIVESGEAFDKADSDEIEKLRAETSGRWCHRCGYCMPCPQDLPISMILNIESFLKLMPFERVFQMASRGMETAKNCVSCGECVKKCPYKLDIPALVKEKMKIWETYES